MMLYKSFIFIFISCFYHFTYPMIHLYTDYAPFIKHTTDLNLITHSTPICTNKTLLQNRKLFLDQLANFTYDAPLEITSAGNLIGGSKKTITLHYKKDLDITEDPATIAALNNSIPTDRIDKTFILKCYKKGENAIREAIGSYIGAALGISVNKIKIIPASISFYGKNFCSPIPCIATLHTYMPGKEIELLQNTHPYQALRDSLATKECFEAAIRHKDLCNIIILDLCADNRDRNDSNYRFDESTNRYHAYDLDNSFATDNTMAHKALDFLKDFLSNKIINLKEKKMIIYVSNMLQRFLVLFPKNDLYHLWIQKSKEAEYIYSDKSKKNIAENLQRHRNDIQELINFLKKFIKGYKTGCLTKNTLENAYEKSLHDDIKEISEELSMSTVFSPEQNRTLSKIRDRQNPVLKIYRQYEEPIAIKEAIGSHIGASAGISVEKVKIILARKHPERISAGCIATLHRYMPGAEVCLTNAQSFYIKNTLANKDGIDAAVYSQDLADIIALDLFINHPERTLLNYLFDEKTGRYHAINQGQSFSSAMSMPHLSFLFLSNLDTISDADKKGLLRVNKRLKQLLELYPVETLHNLWMEKAQEADVHYSDFKKQKIKNKISKLNTEVKKLVTLIDKLTA